MDSTSQPRGRGRGDGMPSLKLGVGVREDVITLWEELDEARNTLAEIQALLCEIKDPKDTPSKGVFYSRHICSWEWGLTGHQECWRNQGTRSVGGGKIGDRKEE